MKHVQSTTAGSQSIEGKRWNTPFPEVGRWKPSAAGATIFLTCAAGDCCAGGGAGETGAMDTCARALRGPLTSHYRVSPEIGSAPSTPAGSGRAAVTAIQLHASPAVVPRISGSEYMFLQYVFSKAVFWD